MIALGELINGLQAAQEALGERALAWVSRYVSEVRGTLMMPPDEGTLFLTSHGEAFSPARLTQLVRSYVKAAEVGKTGACHLFRHTMATLMLENGADIRYALTHPGARLGARLLNEPITHPALAKAASKAAPESRATAEDIFSLLAAEDDETAEDNAEPTPSECGS